jgi:riboflavin synthase
VFTGIIETTGTLINSLTEGSNIHFTFSSPISHELRIDQSVAHNGVCLTVVALGNGTHTVTAIEETLLKTNLGALEIGSTLNLERCMPANGRFDGHIVQGHVDTTATCVAIEDKEGSWEFHFELETLEQGLLLVDKGSICINGVSLTVVKSVNKHFHVAIIPYTYTHTQFEKLKIGEKANIEFDIIGKYLQKQMAYLKA